MSTSRRPDAVGASPAEHAAADPAVWVDRYGDLLYGYAYARVGCGEDARDLVQETLLAGIRGTAAFDGRSKESTWLVGILRHKVYDLLRRRSCEGARRRELTLELEGRGSAFTADGWWTSRLDGAWTLPEAGPMREDFLRVLEAALAELPPVPRQVFYLSVIDDVPTSEVCSLLGLSRPNLWTLLHRARLLLRRELERRWFRAGSGGPTVIRLARTLWFVLTLRCEAADRLRSTRRSDLAWSERFAERAHTMLCKSCRKARRQLDLLNDALEGNRERIAAGGGHALSAADRAALIERLRIESEKD